MLALIRQCTESCVLLCSPISYAETGCNSNLLSAAASAIPQNDIVRVCVVYERTPCLAPCVCARVRKHHDVKLHTYVLRTGSLYACSAAPFPTDWANRRVHGTRALRVTANGLRVLYIGRRHRLYTPRKKVERK